MFKNTIYISIAIFALVHGAFAYYEIRQDITSGPFLVQ